MNVMTPCKFCGALFFRRRVDVVHCSRECRYAAKDLDFAVNLCHGSERKQASGLTSRTEEKSDARVLKALMERTQTISEEHIEPARRSA